MKSETLDLVKEMLNLLQEMLKLAQDLTCFDEHPNGTWETLCALWD
tara:strand:- start:115062 stop:115199 length:138 start_codon:yes stop_codon:yes gene_type:complete